MPRTRKIVMTVFCLEEDAEDVKKQLFDGENQSGFFYDSNVGLANVTVEILEPTPEEDRKAAESLDVLLEEIDPCDWTVEECVNFIETTFGKSILVAAMHEISNDDVEDWRNEVRRRTDEK